MIQEVYKRYVMEIIFHVHKGGVDLPNWKKSKNRKIKKKMLFMTPIQCYANRKKKIKIMKSSIYWTF